MTRAASGRGFLKACRGVVAGAGGLLFGLSACAGGGAAEPVPAILVAPDAEDIAQVARAAEALTGASQVSLAGDVLTTRPDLVLDRQIPRSLEGDPAGGRIMERPPRLTLVKKGNKCLLVDDATGMSEVLAGVTCAPFKAP